MEPAWWCRSLCVFAIECELKSAWYLLCPPHAAGILGLADDIARYRPETVVVALACVAIACWA